MHVLDRLVSRIAPGIMILICQPSWGQHIVDLSVSSESDGQAVAPAAPINWEITAHITGGDSEGLALLVVDLAQDAGNPEVFALPLANDVPPGMESFAPPTGVSNPGQPPEFFGYGGTQLGGDLLQIGGGQDTSGAVAVVEDVALGPEPQVIATGSFPAPSSLGTYVLHIESPEANVLQAVPLPPEPSPVEAATVTMGTPSFTFTVGCPCGDIDMSGGPVNLVDFGLFALCYGRTGPGGDCTQAYFECSDMNASGKVNLEDFGLLALWYGLVPTQTVPNCVPE